MFMEQFKNKVLFFADLDDSIFQTKRKDETGKYKATFPKNILKTSYYTRTQYNLLNFILKNQDIVFIPLTARTEEQFQRTKIYKEQQAPIYSFYYGSSLFINGKEHLKYKKYISDQSSLVYDSLSKIILLFNKKYPEVNFNNINGKYYTTDSKNKIHLDYLLELLKQADAAVDIYSEGKYITIIPKVCNKSTVVKFLQQQLKPIFTIGMGNSISDLDFLNLCNFKIISHIGILHQKLNS